MTTATIRELTKTDRCDRCGAAAKIALQFRNELELLFCDHHYTEHSKQLILCGAMLVGQSEE